MDFKDHLAILREQYKQECDDNNELFRRGVFMYAIIVALGSISFKLAIGSAIADKKVLFEHYLGFAIVCSALSISLLSLIDALHFQQWAYPGPLVSGSKRSEVEKAHLPSLDALHESYLRAVESNRYANIRRFKCMKRSFRCLVAALLLLGVQAVINHLR